MLAFCRPIPRDTYSHLIHLQCCFSYQGTNTCTCPANGRRADASCTDLACAVAPEVLGGLEMGCQAPRLDCKMVDCLRGVEGGCLRVPARTSMKSFQAVAECFSKAVVLDGLIPPGVKIAMKESMSCR